MEEVKAETWAQKATSVLSNLLSDAAAARTSSIKLNNMEYAGELSTQLLDHAKTLEALYQSTAKAIASGSEDKILKGLVGKAQKLEEFGAKAQAWVLNYLNPCKPLGIQKVSNYNAHLISYSASHLNL